MSQYRGAPKPPMSSGRKLAIGAAVVIGAPALVAGMASGLKQNLSKPAARTPPAAAPARPPASVAAPTTRPAPAPVTSAAPAAGPTFTYPGDPQCAITYRDAGGGAMVWTVTTTVPGELITHASGTDGTIYRHDEHVDAGEHPYRAPVPLAQINDIGGNLQADSGTSYGCSVAPQR